jgi:hypothetical protein
MSSPSSARSTCAACRAMPGIASSRWMAGSTGAPGSCRRRAGGAVGVHALGCGDGSDQLLDPGGEAVDLGGQGVVLVQQHPGELGVVVVEPAGERLDQRGVLGLELAAGQAGQHLGVTLAGDQRFQHRPAGFAHEVGGHGGELDQGVFQQPARSAGRGGSGPGSGPAAAACSRAAAGSRRAARSWAAACPARSASPATRCRACRSWPSWDVLDVRALTSCTSRPAASSR